MSRPTSRWFVQPTNKSRHSDEQAHLLIENGYQHMEREDLEAIAVYFRSLKPIVHLY
jgi:hypothetical protein